MTNPTALAKLGWFLMEARHKQGRAEKDCIMISPPNHGKCHDAENSDFYLMVVDFVCRLTHIGDAMLSRGKLSGARTWSEKAEFFTLQ